MTREEFHRKVKCNDSYIGWHNAHELADELYSYFETRMCENCIYAKREHESELFCSYWVDSPLMWKSVFNTDYCSKFKRSTDG